MKEDQKYLYYAAGESLDKIDKLPQTELLKDAGTEILYFTEDVDEFCALHSFHSLFFYPQDKSCGIHRDMWIDFYSPRMLLCSFLMTSSVSLEFLRSSSILLQACITVVWSRLKILAISGKEYSSS